MIDDNTITVAERYVSAGQSSNLRMDTREDAPIGAVGVLVAAGWSASRIGSALMRLHTRADRNTLEQVHEQLAMQAGRWNIEQPVTVAAAVLGWWMSKTCGACHGVKFDRIAETPALSTRVCKACRGVGDKPLPYGESGKRIARLIEECVERAQASIKRRLHTMR